MEQTVDLFIVGGGINGAAIAADASGRGLSVILCEKRDLASGTSSASTKLIHGGLRYLEFYEFHLVRKALQEREILMRRAPNLTRPLEFVLPYESHLRPAWLIRIGLFLYDHLAKRTSIPSSHSVNFDNDPRGKPLLSQFKKGFSYYDCFTDDARLVVLNAMDAKNRGATILTHTKFISAEVVNNVWKITVKTSEKNEKIYYAKTLINAAGPWINHVHQTINNNTELFHIKLDKGSHIIVPKLYEGNFAYLLQNADKRIVFTIPYRDKFTLIGTTDVPFKGKLNNVVIEDSEMKYLCDITNRYFQKQIQPNDVIWSYAGVRCLLSADSVKMSRLSRDYKLVLSTDNSPPLLTIIGGKITTHRTLAEDALKLLKPFFPNMSAAWTANQTLPGSDFPEQDFEKFYQEFKQSYLWLPDELARRYAINYGTNAHKFLSNATSLQALGKDFSQGLYEREINYLIENEWAKSAEDILWRRSKLGLVFTPENADNLQSWISI